MIRNLRNISIRLWLCTLLGVPLSLLVISFLINFFPGLPSLYIGLLITISLFLGLGFLLNYIGRSLIESSIREGEVWERKGILIKSEQNYLKALRVYDTFLLSFWGSKKVTRHLTHVLARFVLTSKRDNFNFLEASTFYLKLNPADEDVALMWLKRFSKTKEMTVAQEDVLSRLAQIHADSPRFLPLLTRFFVEFGRMDFAAHKVYQSALEDTALKPHFESRIKDLIGTDEEMTALERPVLSFQYHPRQKRVPINLKARFTALFQTLVSFFRASASLLISGISFLLLSWHSLFTYLKERESARFYLKVGVLTATGICLLLLMVNTISHLIPSPSSSPEKQVIEIQIPKPFTIQVAAYLKETHADQYVESLKKQGLKAEVRKVLGGGKEWFLVTVSEFPDKASAAESGRHLKSQGIIEDFFVTNKL